MTTTGPKAVRATGRHCPTVRHTGQSPPHFGYVALAAILLLLSPMGYPLRFPGTDALEATPFESDGVILPGRFTYEITVRTHQERLLLRPDKEANEILAGCLGRASHRYPKLGLHVASILSDHATLLATPDVPATMSNFMRDFLSTVARRINDHRDREGRFWSRRFRAIPILDEASVEKRFRYVLTHGTKENLVWSADEWPGLHCVDALRGGKPLVGRWRDFTAESVLRQRVNRKLQRAGRSDAEVGRKQVPQIWREYPIKLVPLPHWQNDRPGTIRQRIAEIARRDAEQTRARHKRDGTRPLGRAKILQTDPFSRPGEPKKSPAPMCHASTKAGRRAYRRAYAAWAELVHDANKALLEQREQAGHPRAVITGPLPSLTIATIRLDVAPVFAGGDPALHFDPISPADLLKAQSATDATGPPH